MPYLLTLFIALVVICVFFFLAWFLTRVIATNGSFNGKGKFISVLERFPITKDSYLLLVKVSDKVLLVGVTGNGMTTLKELDAEGFDIDFSDYAYKKQGFAEVLKETINSSFPDGRVKSALNRMIKKRKGGDGNGEE